MSKIHSTFAGQEDWVELLAEFVAQVPKHIEAIESAVRREDLVTLQNIVHQLRGAYGSYGYHAITPLARDIEQQLQSAQSLGHLSASIADFVSAIGSVTIEPVPAAAKV